MQTVSRVCVCCGMCVELFHRMCAPTMCCVASFSVSMCLCRWVERARIYSIASMWVYSTGSHCVGLVDEYVFVCKCINLYLFRCAVRVCVRVRVRIMRRCQFYIPRARAWTMEMALYLLWHDCVCDVCFNNFTPCSPWRRNGCTCQIFRTSQLECCLDICISIFIFFSSFSRHRQTGNTWMFVCKMFGSLFFRVIVCGDNFYRTQRIATKRKFAKIFDTEKSAQMVSMCIRSVTDAVDDVVRQLECSWKILSRTCSERFFNAIEQNTNTGRWVCVFVGVHMCVATTTTSANRRACASSVCLHEYVNMKSDATFAYTISTGGLRGQGEKVKH